MITDSYQPYEPRTRYEGYEGIRHHSNSKMLKFVCWIRNLDGDYEASKRKTAGKIVVAALAVFGMLLITPLIIGMYPLIKFVDYNRQVSRDLNRAQFQEDRRRYKAETHLAIIEALGGEEACKQIPVELYLQTQKVVTNGGEQLDFIFNADNIRSQAADEIRQIFETNQHPIFQTADKFVALWVENRETGDRVICLMYTPGLKIWFFEQLQEADDINADERIPGIGFTDAESSVPTIKNIVAGTHPDYRLVTFDN